VPVLIVSMHPAEQFAHRAITAGAAGYLTKDADPGELVKIVAGGLKGKRYPAEAADPDDLTAAARAAHEALSDREYQVLRMIASVLWAGVRAGEAQGVEAIVVKVNGDVLTKTELDERQIVTLSRHLGRPVSAAEFHRDASLQQLAGELAPQIVADAIDELLMVQRAGDLGFEA